VDGTNNLVGFMTRPEDKPADEKIAAKVLKLVDLVSYQEGAVVSRTIVDEKAGTVTLFAFADGQGLSEHTAPYDALVHIVDGEAEVTISGRAFKLKKDEIITMPANSPHALKAIREFKMILTMIRTSRKH